jgi:predicted Zn-dependent peptidase
MPHMASVCVGLWAAVGSRHESARLNGAAHFLEHLLFKGTKRRSARRISGEVEGLGGYLEAFTAEDHTCYYAKAEAGRLRQLGDVLADIYAHSRLPAAEVERERGVIREEILMYQDQPAQVAEDLLAATMWAGHPLGRPLAGTLKSLGALRRDDLLTFWRNGYHAGATVLAVAGKVTHARVLEQLGPFLTELPPGRAPRCRAWRQTAPAARQRPQAVVQRQENEQVQVVLGFIAVGRHDPRRFALRVLNALLGEKMDSRLFQSLRERRGLCYSVQSELTTYAETGLLSISVGLDARQLRPALGLIRREIERLCAQPPGAREMREARDYLIGQHRLGLESTTSQMMWLAESILGHGRVARPEEAEEALAAVTAADVQAAACDALRDGFRALVAVGPVTAAPAEVLGWFGSV